MCVDFNRYPLVKEAYIWYRLHLLHPKRIALLQFKSWRFPRSLFKIVDFFFFSIVLSPWCWELQSQWTISQFLRAWSSAERKCLTGYCSNIQKWLIRFRLAKQNVTRTTPFSVHLFGETALKQREFTFLTGTFSPPFSLSLLKLPFDLKYPRMQVLFKYLEGCP